MLIRTRRFDFNSKEAKLILYGLFHRFACDYFVFFSSSFPSKLRYRRYLLRLVSFFILSVNFSSFFNIAQSKVASRTLGIFSDVIPFLCALFIRWDFRTYFFVKRSRYLVSTCTRQPSRSPTLIRNSYYEV